MENEALQYPLEITLRMHGGTNGGIIFTIKNKSIQINILISLKSRPQAGFLMPVRMQFNCPTAAGQLNRQQKRAGILPTL